MSAQDVDRLQSRVYRPDVHKANPATPLSLLGDRGTVRFDSVVQSLAGQCRDLQLPVYRKSACIPADINYLASAASCAAALFSAAFTAARNESVPLGACTSPESVFPKGTFFP